MTLESPQNPHVLTLFIDNKQLNNREDLQPHTFVDFNQIGGLKGASEVYYDWTSKSCGNIY